MFTFFILCYVINNKIQLNTNIAPAFIELSPVIVSGTHPTVAAIQRERDSYSTQMELLSSQLQTAEAEKKKADNEVAKLESLVSNLQRQVFSR